MIGLVERYMVDPSYLNTYVLAGRRISKSPMLEVCLSSFGWSGPFNMGAKFRYVLNIIHKMRHCFLYGSNFISIFSLKNSYKNYLYFPLIKHPCVIQKNLSVLYI